MFLGDAEEASPPAPVNAGRWLASVDSLCSRFTEASQKSQQ
jgi:hypothetical protein